MTAPSLSGAGQVDVVISFSPWDTWADAVIRQFCRPPDQTYLSMARNPRVRRVLLADPWRSRAIDLVKALRGRPDGFPADADHRHLRPLGLRRKDPASVPTLRRRYARYDARLHRAASSFQLVTPAHVTFNPFVAAFAPARWCRSLTYYARDDWTAFARSERWHEAIAAAYAEIRRRGVRVCAVSSVLAERVAGDGSSLVLPNGIDPGLWRQRPEAPAAYARLARPLVGYAGSIDDRLDVEAVLDLARSGVAGTIAMIGPVMDAECGRRLTSHPSVRLIGNLGQRELVAALMALDACLLPHVDTPLTRAMSPLKLYEYLATGAPVVATDLPPVRGVDDDRVLLVGDRNFVEPTRRALDMSRLDESERSRILDRHSWRTRHDLLLDFMLAGADPADR